MKNVGCWNSLHTVRFCMLGHLQSQSIQFVNIVFLFVFKLQMPHGVLLLVDYCMNIFFCCPVDSALLFPGFRMRQRQVVVDPVGTLAGCPHLVESIPCEDARCHEWLVAEGPCVTDRGKCGPGHRVLKAVCRSRRGELGCAPKSPLVFCAS